MGKLQDEQVEHMVNRFLQWRLPEDFHPDAGISFKPTFNDHLPEPMKCNPIGTNLFDYTQAKEMVKFMLEGMPDSDCLNCVGDTRICPNCHRGPKFGTSKEKVC